MVNYRFVYLDYNRAWLNGIQNATMFANFSFTAYQYNTRSNSSGNLYGSSLAKMIANTKNNTPFDIILQIQGITISIFMIYQDILIPDAALM
ncbi:MAG: hypothetical protein ACJ71G_12565 [Nitrososphaeraceae archaeon]